MTKIGSTPIGSTAMGSTAIGLVVTTAGGDGLNGNGRDVNGLYRDGDGPRQCATTAAVDGGGVVADNGQLP